MALAATLFDGGARKAQTEQAMAAYDGTVAFYRQTVLTGFQDVEDNLAALRILDEEAQVQEQAVKSAQESVTIDYQPIQGRNCQLPECSYRPNYCPDK